MLAVQLTRFGPPEEAIELIELDDPGPPAAGEVVVDAELFPINPADVLNLQGAYGATAPALPMIPGAEGVGTLAAVGEGVTHVKKGDRVLLPGAGVWRQRIKAPAAAVFALPAGVDPQQLAMLRVNPPTAYLMLHQFVPPRPGQWLIQNAANSGVGSCLVRLAKRVGVKTANVVRRQEMVAPLRGLGGDLVLLDGPDLDARVREAIGKDALPLAIDAVGGDATRRLARCLSDGGTVVNYGLLSGEACRIDGRETVFRDITLRGFWLRKWFMETPREKIAATYQELIGLVADGTLAVKVEKVYPIREIKAALAHAARGGRSGKILVSFGP